MEEYVVKEGDTLSEILYNMTGNGSSDFYNQVASANNIENPDLIVPGQVIKIDTSNSSTNSNSTTTNTASTNSTTSSQSSSQSSSTTNQSTTSNSSNDNVSTQLDGLREIIDQPANDSSKGTNTSSTGSTVDTNKLAQDYYSNPNRGHREPTTNATNTNTQAAKTGYDFTSVVEDEGVQMNLDEASNFLQNTLNEDLSNIYTHLVALVSSLTTMEKDFHSNSDSDVGQDYKDLEALTTALSDFYSECRLMVTEVNNYLDSVQKTLWNRS